MPNQHIMRMRLQLGGLVRLVAMVRNPSDRFYSAYNMANNDKNSNAYDAFAGSLDRMIACAPGCPDMPKVVSMFFNYGLYAKHLIPFITHFGREALLIECSEDFFTSPRPTVERVLSFAGLRIPSKLSSLLEKGNIVRMPLLACYMLHRTSMHEILCTICNV